MTLEILREPVLVGRQKELSELTSHLECAVDGKGITVFVSGDAGAGKTKLTNEFLKRAKQREVVVLSGSCLGNVAVPYLPFVEAFDAYFSSLYEEESKAQLVGANAKQLRTEPNKIEELRITAWLTGFSPSEKFEKVAAPSPQVWKNQLFAAIGKTLQSISAQSPIILFIEDIHWADSASLALLHYVSRNIKSERILLLATFRSEELTADEDGHPHPLAEVLRLMRREDLFSEIKLPNLGKKEISRIVEHMIGGTVQPELIDRLTKESQGNALFMVESLRMLFERKSLIKENGQWRLTVDELGIPSKIKDIILGRLAILNHSQRRILDVASVIGERFNVELLSAMLEQDTLKVLEKLNEIERSSSLVCIEGNTFRFNHVKSRDTLYSEIPFPLRQGYHARVAEKLEVPSGDGKLPLGMLAFHFIEAGEKEKSLKYALAAGAETLARFSNTEAIKHFNYVLQTLKEDKAHTEEKVIALEGLGDALFANGFFGEARNKYEQLNNDASSATIKLRALRKAVVSCYWQGDSERAMELAAKAENYSQADCLEYSRLRLYKGYINARSFGRKHEALQDMKASLRVFEEKNSLADLARALIEISFILGWDRRDESLSDALRSVLLYEELGDLSEQGFATGRLVVVLRQCGFMEEASEAFSAAIEINKKIGNYNFLALGYMVQGASLEIFGDDQAAIAQSLKGLEAAEKTDAHYAQSLCYGNLVREYSKIGEMEHAEEFSKKLDELFECVPSLKSSRIAVRKAKISKAVLLSRQGLLKDAEKLFREHISLNDIEGVVDYAWVLKKLGQAEEAKKILSRWEEIIEENRARFGHCNIKAHILVSREVSVGEELEIRLDIVNVGRKPATLKRIEGIVIAEFETSKLPSSFSQKNGAFQTSEQKLNSIQVESIKLSLKPTKSGVFCMNPEIIYIDDVGEERAIELNPISITVRPILQIKIEGKTLTAPILSKRVSTGFAKLDYLLLGGIPENYAVILTAPPSDERETIIKNFLKTGAKEKQTTFYVTTEATRIDELYEKPDFYLFLCNPKPKTPIPDLPSIIWLKSKTDLNNLNMALVKASRNVQQRQSVKRILIENISDVLLKDGPEVTRRWLSELITDLGSKGFIILAVLDPEMHPAVHSRAVINLFDGEISLTQTEDPLECRKSLRIKKLRNQDYIKNPIWLKT